MTRVSTKRALFFRQRREFFLHITRHLFPPPSCMWCSFPRQEASILLSQLVTLIPASRVDVADEQCGGGQLLSVHQVQEIGQVFIKVLTSCRHKVSHSMHYYP